MTVTSTAPPVTPTLPRLLAGVPLGDLAAHHRQWGPLPFAGRELIGELERAGLRGRGGAGFPAAVKMAAVAARRHPIVVVNATEGEPASGKDRTLAVAAPHLVLDGAVAAAWAVGATEVIVAVDRTTPVAVASLARAAEDRAAMRRDRVGIEVVATPDRYVAGQASALVNWCNGRDAKPSVSPPRQAQRGVDGRPTLVQNAETLANVALIARFGAGWYRQVGTESDPGTALLSVSGAVGRPGVYEVPFGTPLRHVLDAAGGTPAGIAAALLGGYYGSWLAPEDLDVALESGPLSRLGASVGAGVLAVLPAGACGLAESARVVRWLAGQSAGQCGPCAHGLPAIAGALEAVAAAERSGRAAAAVHRWTAMVEGRGACHLPDGTARLARSAVAVFAGDVERHRMYGPCPPHPPVLPTPATGGWR